MGTSSPTVPLLQDSIFSEYKLKGQVAILSTDNASLNGHLANLVDDKIMKLVRRFS